MTHRLLNIFVNVLRLMVDSSRPYRDREGLKFGVKELLRGPCNKKLVDSKQNEGP